MALRSTQERVREVIGTSTKIDVTPFLNIANRLVTYVVSLDSDGDLTSELQEDVETYLAAHFYAIRDLQYSKKETGDANATFQGKTDMGLDSTLWGQMAKMIDVTGELARLGSRQKIKGTVTWLGKKPSEQIDYVDRL